ncbi:MULTISPECIES: FAD-dependent oxidoreductase [unclassified Mesorhizobium]|uniref:NAD(P)/FAD-dependent oxidoreductase n=1 Tax=unclassified Mesorhizobium TaxID=325217 RepID=UPI001093717E|nr:MULTISPECIES: FAD-dependent oxidoreductase [unclassified Mesorhizobium]TGU40205.1 FAD-binding oxidoreductase [bacterium M00.F.Ca.ET.156.01.1.1]TGQ77118.1 FAD-binding oxidoreductase [Mesorhizobium sp. M8A.F.Ca.ET.207.01.1.1]TGQ89222.1 FAD-binding oxidoreductase [Mesorhizobium sp. M8A.F.Ca.ET.208.01.1.1]TGR32326.1 FAD-binding oxidoreductase [Mesorhizobium sp. M8A.F.Ca.ET.202.01.1.1]TGS38091.1 FAD-binding oxidoreductase [Mesorhizobium sp. M8A.F.Ca.ET.182.01.1.1]
MRRAVDDVLIIGGGLQGCSIALFLARAGRQVTVIEKNLAGRHASGVNAGGLRLLMRDVREYPLSLRAMEMWENLTEYVGAAGAEACEVRLGTSQIALAMDAAELDWAEVRAQDMRRRGIFSEELIGPEELHRLLPGLARSALGGLISRRDGHANPANAARAFRDAAEAAGVRIVERCALRELRRAPGGNWAAETDAGSLEAERIINCAGAWGANVAALVGETLPMKILALTMMVTARVQAFVTPVVIGIDQPLSFKQSAVGSLVIGGGISGKPCPDQDTSFTIMDRMASSAIATITAFPALAGVPVLRTWTGLEGATPDGIPFIGPSTQHDGLWHVFGFCGHGFQLAPAIGEIVAQSLISGAADSRLAPFAADRFRTKPPLNHEALQ